jgi:hypothetical protein
MQNLANFIAKAHKKKKKDQMKANKRNQIPQLSTASDKLDVKMGAGLVRSGTQAVANAATTMQCRWASM